MLVGVWIVHQGGLSTLIPAHDAAPASTSAQGGDSGPSTQASPSSNVLPAGFTPQASALKSIAENGIVRISVQNPSEPFFGEDKGTPHGFNVEFARLLFADPSFSHGGKPVVVDTRHEVDTYPGVPKQLLDTDAKGNHVVDVAMDGLTFPDNTPSGIVYSVPYVDDFGYSLIVRRGSAIRSTDDLAGKTVGILKGDPDVRAFVTRQYPNVKFVEVDDSDPAFIAKSIDGHAVDAFIYDYPFAVSSIKDTDLKFAVTKLDGSNIAYKIGVRADDQDLLIYLNAAIAKLKQSPQYLDLLRKYFVSDQAGDDRGRVGRAYVRGEGGRHAEPDRREQARQRPALSRDSTPQQPRQPEPDPGGPASGDSGAVTAAWRERRKRKGREGT